MTPWLTAVGLVNVDMLQSRKRHREQGKNDRESERMRDEMRENVRERESGCCFLTLILDTLKDIA